MANVPKVARKLTVAQTMARDGELNSLPLPDLERLDVALTQVIGYDYGGHGVHRAGTDCCVICGHPGWMHSDLGRCPT